MAPLGTLISVEETVGPQILNRYQLYPSAAINGEAAPGYSSGQAIAAMERIAAETLPAGYGHEWTGTSRRCSPKASCRARASITS